MDFFFLEAHALIRDHPCLRGEYMVDYIASCSSEESPPLARGILKKQSQIQNVYGITPACAGNTALMPARLRNLQDHPRLRGEYLVTAAIPYAVVGSPPLARGIRDFPVCSFPIRGITPACAGNTISQLLYLAELQDHPRLRGEYHQTIHQRRRRNRITPACAGNTHIHSGVRHSLKDHPRLRGEYENTTKNRIDAKGSPPLARGIQDNADSAEYRIGITPACAGNT